MFNPQYQSCRQVVLSYWDVSSGQRPSCLGPLSAWRGSGRECVWAGRDINFHSTALTLVWWEDLIGLRQLTCLQWEQPQCHTTRMEVRPSIWLGIRVKPLGRAHLKEQHTLCRSNQSWDIFNIYLQHFMSISLDNANNIIPVGPRTKQKWETLRRPIKSSKAIQLPILLHVAARCRRSETAFHSNTFPSRSSL